VVLKKNYPGNPRNINSIWCGLKAGSQYDAGPVLHSVAEYCGSMQRSTVRFEICQCMHDFTHNGNHCVRQWKVVVIVLPSYSSDEELELLLLLVVTRRRKKRMKLEKGYVGVFYIFTSVTARGVE